MVDNRQSKAFFEELAKEYDSTRNLRFLESARASLQYYIDTYNVSNRSALEIGVGTGETLVDLEETFSRVTGMDISMNMTRVALAKRRSPRTTACVASAEALPYKDQSFTTTICMDVLEHVNSPWHCLREIVRVLEVKGVAYITTPSPLWAPVHWVAEHVGLKVKEGPHRFVSVLHLGYLVFAPLPIFSRPEVGRWAARQPVLRKFGHNQLVILRREG
jgi:ubiquinone/menaquinone biosynthesis C-methylase UbiE